MLHLLCNVCGAHAHFLTVSAAARLIGVTRATMHNWIDRGWVHVLLLPNGRRVVCRESLVRRDTTISTGTPNGAA